jgi:ElaB/YqjD/DUF883 family membrane-anchored ribosome-binding protein
MTAEPVNAATDESDLASRTEAAGRSDLAFKDGLAEAERAMTEAAKVAERVIRQGIDVVRAQTKAYSADPAQTVDEAQRYIVERIKERPVTAALAGVGVGFLLGLMISGRGR